MLSLREILGRIARGDAGPAETLAESAARIAEREPQLQAFASRPEALQPGSGPLAGIACGVKDIIDTADLPTQMGSPIYGDWRPRADAPIVMALRATPPPLPFSTRPRPSTRMTPRPAPADRRPVRRRPSPRA